MIEVMLESGKLYKAKDKNDLVSILANEMDESIEDYMKGVAHRCKIWDGSDIKYNNTEEFVNELIRVGVIKNIYEI